MTNELIDFTLVSVALLAIGIYGLAVKRNFIRMLFAVEIIINAANLNLVAFGRFLPHAGGQTLALFSIAIASRSGCRIIVNYCSIPYVSKCRYC
jgi:NADH:ubiquinone oxidoreductase subunit K